MLLTYARSKFYLNSCSDVYMFVAFLWPWVLFPVERTKIIPFFQFSFCLSLLALSSQLRSFRIYIRVLCFVPPDLPVAWISGVAKVSVKVDALWGCIWEKFVEKSNNKLQSFKSPDTSRCCRASRAAVWSQPQFAWLIIRRVKPGSLKVYVLTAKRRVNKEDFQIIFLQ